MVGLVSSLSTVGYRTVVKPLLFQVRPDIVHERMLKGARFLQRLPGFGAVVRWMFVYTNQSMLSQTIDDITFANPVGLAAGFDKNLELPATMRAIGFGFMTGGSITYEPCPGNPRPWFHRLPSHKALLVHAGLANAGAAATKERISRLPARLTTQFPIIASIAKTNSPVTVDDDAATADYINSLRQLRDNPAIAAFELNISCPNTYAGEPFTTPERLERLLKAVDKLALNEQIWVKMPINLDWRDFDNLLTVLLRHHIRTVTIGNLNKDRTGISSEMLPSSTKGNLSGLPTQALSDELIRQTYRAYGDRLTIIGVGGIFTARDAYRKICLGATLVEMITGLIYEGPQVVGQINRDLVKLLREDGFRTIGDAIGCAHKISEK